MKTTIVILSLVTVLGCGTKSEFDITPAQAMNAKKGPGQHKITLGGKGGIDLNHLPPGAVKHERVFKKGEMLPNGTPAKGGEKMVTVEVNEGKPGGPTTSDKDITITQ